MTSGTALGEAVPQKTRIAVWDNARFVLLALVVIGHLTTTVRTETALGFGLYSYIYLFHMPALMLLSGLFSKPETSPKAIKSTVQLLVTWLLWEGLWALFHGFAEGRPPGSSFLVSPAWTLWFLVSLVTLRILLPYIAMLRHPLLFSVVLALVAPLLANIGPAFSAARTLAFLPFFVGGWLIRERGWLSGEWFMHPAARTRLWGWLVLAAVALGFALLPALKDTWRIDKWLTHRDGYAALFREAPIGGWHPGEWWAIAAGGIGVQAALMLLAAAMTVAVLLVVPRGRSAITAWGSRTLFIYLLHAPIIYFLRDSGFVDSVGALGAIGILLLIVIGIALASLLSTGWVAKVFRPVIEPRVDWLLRRA